VDGPIGVGEQVLMRHVLGARTLMALPMTVAHADGGTIATWIAPGTPIVYPNGLHDGRLLPIDRWGVERRRWVGPGRLDLTPLSREHAIRLHWRSDGSFAGWYVNLQARPSRTRLGYDTMDWQLDLWIEPGGAVRVKDADHLEQAVELGILDRRDAEAAHAEAERVLSAWPFPTGWESWRPDPAWEVPVLPAGWDRVEMDAAAIVDSERRLS
jgi:hypothetical protein